MEYKERAWRFFWSIRVDREVRGRIIKLHEDSVSVNACSECGSAQGPFTVRPIGITGAMKNSVAAIHVDGIRK
ncbi:hypothetical protein DVH24_034279 [Malus domestica]|uniref:Uncharacterized protein n=1 Tax=Malus domestica TaxID=3750 RepID=A0A498IVJ4_MALDO|nr:hypothetical protein DVH24_034279 [Malus domestica]